MFERAYVVDIAVSDLAAAAGRFSVIFGMDPIRTDEYDPGAAIQMCHFPIGGLNAIGLMAIAGTPDASSRDMVSRRLATAGEGAFLVGFLVDDIEAEQSRLEEDGLRSVYRKPIQYEAGRLNMWAHS